MRNWSILKLYDNSWFDKGASGFKRVIWYAINTLFLSCRWNVSSKIRVWLLRLFGAKIGTGVVIRPRVSIKYPWRLNIGDYCWLGESVWIDNLADVKIGNNVVLSQGSMLLCGNHDYKKKSFDLIVGEITLEDCVWCGAKSVVCPGVKMCSGSILTVGSVATHDCDSGWIYQGNPALPIRKRAIEE